MSSPRFIPALLLLAACGTTDLPAPFDGGPDGSTSQADVGLPDRDDGAHDAERDLGGDPSDLGPDADVDPVNNGTPAGPTRYFAGPTVQPVTPSVVQSMSAIRASSAGPDDDAFIKVGASGTVNLANLTCFGPTSSYRVELDGRPELQNTIDRFNVRTFANQSSWDRTTEAAEVGRTAAWVQTGNPSPLQREISALNPRFALVNYGTNDMQQGVTHRSALWPFYDNMLRMITALTARGIIPILTGLNPRSDNDTAALWVPTYDAVTRALAESFQLPYVDLYVAVRDLPAQGLISDGIHGNSYSDGGSQPCVFTPAGLQFNYNVRNLLTLQLLDEVSRTVLGGEPATATNPRAWSGSGSAADPFFVDTVPFSHHGDTSTSPHSDRDSYPTCDGGQDESGPELTYRLQLDTATPLRIMVFDATADVDVHLIDSTTCVARHDRVIEGTFGPGTYEIVADTFVSSASGPQTGPYTLVVVQCEPGDPDCS